MCAVHRFAAVGAAADACLLGDWREKMSEYVFRYALGHGFSEGMTMEDGRTSAHEYYIQENSDHYGTIHEEIVRCRDCVHWHHMDEIDGVRYGDCDEFSPKAHYEKHATRESGFCAWGERCERETAEVWNHWSADDVTCSEES